jgi:hypothetical protein
MKALTKDQLRKFMVREHRKARDEFERALICLAAWAATL